MIKNIRTGDTLKTFLFTFLILLVIKSLNILPWWTFIIPLTALGFAIAWKNWKVHCFLTGFITGFISWSGLTLYFDQQYSGDITYRIGSMPRVILLVLTGLIGGLLTGLALYTGKSMVTSKRDQVVL